MREQGTELQASAGVCESCTLGFLAEKASVHKTRARSWRAPKVTAGPAALVLRPECLLPQELLPLPDHKLYEGRDWLANSCCTPRAQLRVVQTIDCGLLVAREINATEQQMSEPATHDMARHVQLQ